MIDIKFNSVDYIYLIIINLIIIFLYFFINKNNSKKTNKKILIILSIFNLFLYLIKILFPPYSNLIYSTPKSNFPNSLIYITINSLCSFSIFIYPFSFIIKNKYIKDSIYVLGIIGGIFAILFINNSGPFINYFDFIRFILEHLILIIVGLFSYIFKINSINFKSFILLPIYFLFIQIIIYINNLILLKIGLIEHEYELFVFYNFSFLYGPYLEFDKPLKFVDILIPKILKYKNYDYVYYPIYLLIPTLIYIYPASLFLFKLLTINKKIHSKNVSK